VPYITLNNIIAEDTDGGRESQIIFRGRQADTEVSNLAIIEASHDGVSSNQAGQLLFKVNNGVSDDSPSISMSLSCVGMLKVHNEI